MLVSLSFLHVLADPAVPLNSVTGPLEPRRALLHLGCIQDALFIPSVCASWGLRECSSVSFEVDGAVPNTASDCRRRACNHHRYGLEDLRGCSAKTHKKQDGKLFCKNSTLMFVCVHPSFSLLVSNSREKRLS